MRFRTARITRAKLCWRRTSGLIVRWVEWTWNAACRPLVRPARTITLCKNCSVQYSSKLHHECRKLVRVGARWDLYMPTTTVQYQRADRN